MEGYPTLEALNSGHIVDIEGSGIRVVKIDGKLQPGDNYVAERNLPASMFTVRSINHERGWVNAREKDAYSYDIHECVRVAIVDIS